MDNKNLGFQNADTTHGEGAHNIVSDDIQQNYSDTCAVKSQQLILEKFGVEISEEQLVGEATSYGWYASGGGTAIDNVGNLLELHGVEVNQIENANIFNLTNELAKGHQVIVAVDSGELWYDSFYEGFEDKIMGDRPDHALIVSGIDTSDPEDIKVIITDPGTGDYCKEYPMNEFVDAWKDSNSYMVTTVEPAPFDYNQDQMINFDYELGHIQEIGELPYSDFESLVTETPELLDEDIEHDEVSLGALGNYLKGAVFGAIPGYNLFQQINDQIHSFNLEPTPESVQESEPTPVSNLERDSITDSLPEPTSKSDSTIEDVDDDDFE